MNPPGISREGPPQNATGTESQSITKKARRTVELVRARHETLIRRVLVGWGQGTSTLNRGPTLSAKQQLILRDLVIEMAVELGQAGGRELLARTLSPEQFESDLSNLLESTASNAVARWRSFTGRYQLRTQTKVASRPEVEIRKRVIDQLTPAAESLLLEAWSAHGVRLEAEGCAEASQTTNLETAAACSQAMPTSGAPNQKIADLLAALDRGDRKCAVELWQKRQKSAGLPDTKAFLYKEAAQDKADYYRWEKGQKAASSQAERGIRRVLLKPFS